MSRVIAISNQKGGVGKTTTCISMGACLAEMGASTLIVDLDSQANLTMAVGLDPDELEHAIPDLLSPEEDQIPPDPSMVIQHTALPGLDILPSDLRLASAERMLYNSADYERLLGRILQPWRSKYDYILIDCPPSLGALTLMALTASQYVLIPVQPEYYAARGLIRLLDVIDAVQQHTNQHLNHMLVVTLYDQRNSISRRVLEQLQESFRDHILSTIIFVDTRLRESSVIGEPIIVFAPKTRASKNYRQLAREMHQILESNGV